MDFIRRVAREGGGSHYVNVEVGTVVVVIGHGRTGARV